MIPRRIWLVLKFLAAMWRNEMNAVDRTIAPEIKQVEHFSIVQPERQVMGNGMPLYVIAAGSEDVVRFDLVIKGGQLHQTQPLQAVLTNRMLREGTSGMTSC